jgi:hypothetical protein
VRRVPLGDIATLRSGYVPSAAEARERKRQEDEERRRPGALTLKGTEPTRTLGLQPSAIQPDGTVAWGEVVTLLPVRGAERYEIREGELLLPLRSQRIQSVVARDVPNGVLAIGQWALIGPDPDQADAEYLVWYLNHPQTRARLAGTMVGTSLQFLTVTTVRDFEVKLPNLATQRRIGRIAQLTARVSRLERRLADERQQLADAVAMAALHAAGEPNDQAHTNQPTRVHSDD